MPPTATLTFDTRQHRDWIRAMCQSLPFVRQAVCFLDTELGRTAVNCTLLYTRTYSKSRPILRIFSLLDRKRT
jgi:hypothetical protein